jgi:tRNA(Ile2) C34 agmatinyltransferase TiaS
LKAVFNPFKAVHARIKFSCPECNTTLDIVGHDDSVFWCSECQVGYQLKWSKTSLTKKDLADVVGFPKEVKP